MGGVHYGVRRAGISDDLIGDKEGEGVPCAAIFRAVSAKRRVTTGLVKAAGGLLAALAAGVYLHRSEPLQILLVAGVIALCAKFR